MLDCVIDVSHHNSVTDWAAIKAAGIRGVIHKSTQGTGFVDPQYHPRRPQALDAGLLWGAYHFGEAGPVLPQLRHFLNTVQPVSTDLLVLDWEQCGPDTMTLEGAELFVDEAYISTGRWIGLYSGQAFCTDALAGCTDTPLARCWLWLARYSTQPPVVPPAWETFSLWQWTDQGSVPGIQGYVDRNQWNGDEAGLRRLWGVEEQQSHGA